MRALLNSARNLLPFTRYAYGGDAVACNLCGCMEKVSICRFDRRLKRLDTIACAECGLIRTDPMPTEAELVAYYAREYRRDYQFAYGKTPPRTHLRRTAREADARMSFIAPALKPGARILDFGSGSGAFLSLAKKSGHEVLGIEPGEDFAAYARDKHGVEVIIAPWQDVQLTAGQFDVITASHVIEHLREPVSALRQLARWLSDDGSIYVAVPNAFAKRDQTFQHFHFAHVHTFTPQTLIWAGEAAGLELDPRVAPQDTTVVFRKAPKPARNWPPGQGQVVAAKFSKSDPLLFLLSGRWVGDAFRRLRRASRDPISTPNPSQP